MTSSDPERDNEERQMAVPEDLMHELTGCVAPQPVLAGLANSHGREYLQWIEAAKKPETRNRGIQWGIERFESTL